MTGIRWRSCEPIFGDRDDGGSAVEFAILAIVFFALVFGGITAGLAYGQKNQLVHAAREAARYGAVLPLAQFSSACPSRAQECWAEEVRDRAIRAAAGQLDIGVPGRRVCVALVEGSPPSVVELFWTDTDASKGKTPCFDDSSPDSGRRVQVLVQRQSTVEFVFFRATPTVTSKAIGLHEASSTIPGS